MQKKQNKTKSQQGMKKKEGSSLGKAPVAQARRVTTSKPKIQGRANNGDIRVQHREYISDVAGSVAFASTEFLLNAGSLISFPWLSSIARQYESYSFRSLKFCYESQAPTTATGTVLLVLDYDAADAAPLSKVEAMSYRNSVRSAPWQESSHRSSPEDLHKMKSYYVRDTTILAANLDVKTYDIGNLFVCTQGQANTNAIGELYVEYDVDLMTPQLVKPLVPGFKLTTTAGQSNVLPWGTSWTLDPDNNIRVTVDSGTQLTFNETFEGLLILSTSAAGAATAAGNGQIGAGTATVSELVDLVTSPATTSSFGGAAVYSVRAVSGQTVILTWAFNIAYGSASLRLMAYPVVTIG